MIYFIEYYEHLKSHIVNGKVESLLPVGIIITDQFNCKENLNIFNNGLNGLLAVPAVPS